MCKVSIVIPVYNSAPYLDDCLKSCLHQTLTDIEIICIDDKSTDGSLAILHAYAASDSRIKVVEKDTNSRQGSARNLGVSLARGEYLWFVDSDDYIAIDAVELIYNFLRKNTGLAMVCFNAVSFIETDKGNEFLPSNYLSRWPMNQVIDFEADSETISTSMNVSPCLFVASWDLLSKIRFREGVVHEDTDYVPILYHQAKRIYYLNYTPYYRRVRLTSTTGGKFTVARMTDLLKAIISLRDYIKLNQLSNKHFLSRFYRGQAGYFQSIYRQADIGDRESIQREIKGSGIKMENRVRADVMRIIKKFLRSVISRIVP